MVKQFQKWYLRLIMIIGIMLGIIGITDIRADASNIHALSISGYPKGNNNCELMYDRIALTELSGYYANAYVQKYTYNSEKTASNGGSTAATMDRKIADVLQNSSRNDIMIFYYYGHSVSDGEGSSLGLALNAIDGYCNEWYTWDRLARNLASFPGNIYVILDTCHSEDFWTKGVRSLTNSDAQERFSCLLACGANETSKYGSKLLFTTPTKLVDAKYYGSFTFNIGKGLGFWNGVSAADNNSNGYVTINELYTYVQQHISGFDKMTVKKYGSHLNDPLFHYSVHFNYSNLTMVVKEKKTLEAYVTGSKVPAKWSSSNSSVATVNSKGKITAKKAGTTIITAEINGSRTTCKVTVKSKESIKLNKTSATVNKGSSITLKATVTGLSKKVTWATSDKKIATVKNGKVTGKKAGKVTITAKANGKSAKCVVKVVSKKSKALAAYKSFLSKRQGLSCQGTYTTFSPDAFYIYDVNKDGIPELIVSDKDLCSNKHLANHCHICLYTWDGRKVKIIDGLLTTKSNIKKFRIYSSVQRVAFKGYSDYWASVNVSDSWIKNPSGSYKTVSMYSNTISNRKKYIK